MTDMRSAVEPLGAAENRGTLFAVTGPLAARISARLDAAGFPVYVTVRMGADGLRDWSVHAHDSVAGFHESAGFLQALPEGAFLAEVLSAWLSA